MRILIIVSRYLPHMGGLENVVRNLAQELILAGDEVKIITNRYPRSLPAQETIDGIPVTRLDFLLPDFSYFKRHRFDLFFASLFFRIWTEIRLERFVQEFKPDVIHSQYLSEPAEFTRRILTKRWGNSIPWVITLQGGDVDGEPLIGKSHLLRFRRAVNRADKITACSRNLANQAEELEPSIKDKVRVIFNGVNVNQFSTASSYVSAKPYIFAVGQLVHHKGFDILIDAFGEVSKKHSEVNLIIGGEGEFRPSLENQLLRKGLEHRVLLTGKIDSAKVSSMMAGSIFVAMPSRREPFGIVALEGMASGKCVLASPVGGLPEFLPVPPNRLAELEVSKWAEAMDEWLDLAKQGRLIGKDNIAKAVNFDWTNIANQYRQVYEELIHLNKK